MPHTLTAVAERLTIVANQYAEKLRKPQQKQNTVKGFLQCILPQKPHFLLRT